MIIDCHRCKARVDAEVLAQYEDNEFFTTRTLLLACPSCRSALVAECEQDHDLKWTELIRVHPG